MDYKEVIDNIYNEVKPLFGQGKVADYIPALANINPRQYGIAIATLDGQIVGTGDYQTKFSIQSISKVFTLSMVVRHMGGDLWKYVGREPSGTPFNSLVQLEHEQGIPRNPFINAGALVVTDKVMNLYHRPKEAILQFVRSVAGNDDIYYDKTVAQSEFEHASRNQALGHFMKSFGNIDNDVDSLIDVYCNQCSIAMTCEDLAKSFLVASQPRDQPAQQREYPHREPLETPQRTHADLRFLRRIRGVRFPCRNAGQKRCRRRRGSHHPGQTQYRRVESRTE